MNAGIPQFMTLAEISTYGKSSADEFHSIRFDVVPKWYRQVVADSE